MEKNNQAILEVANIKVADVVQAIKWCDALTEKYDEEACKLRKDSILAKDENTLNRIRQAIRNVELYKAEFERYRACLVDLIKDERNEESVEYSPADPENVRTLMTILRNARFIVMTQNKSVNPAKVLGDPNLVSVREFMLRVHPDRVRMCRESLRLTCCSDLVLEQNAFLIANKRTYSPMEILVNMLGYDGECARDALLGSIDAVQDFVSSPASTWVQPASVWTVSDNYHYIPSREDRKKEVCFDDYLHEKAEWIPDIVKEKSKVILIGRKIAFINGRGNYLEMVDPDHCQQERSRFSVSVEDYWKCQCDDSAVKAVFILSSVRDACRLVEFFESFMSLDGIVFVSIGSSFRTEAAIKAIYDNKCSNIYTGLFNRGCAETVSAINNIYPWSKRLPWKEKLVKDGISNDELAKMMPDEIRNYYFSLHHR